MCDYFLDADAKRRALTADDSIAFGRALGRAVCTAVADALFDPDFCTNTEFGAVIERHPNAFGGANCNGHAHASAAPDE